MTTEELRDRLVKSAEALEWSTAVVPAFVERRFRGRTDESAVALPDTAFGLRLGAYPVIVARVALGSVSEMQASLRKLHSQMVIARSYMRADEVINAHLILCAADPSPEVDWRSVVDLAERDETVCRKLIWIPDKAALNGSYSKFVSRTFLAAPWRGAEEKSAPLDNNQGLAQRILVKHGLSPSVADQWIATVQSMKQDPDAMVVELVKDREVTP